MAALSDYLILERVFSRLSPTMVRETYEESKGDLDKALDKLLTLEAQVEREEPEAREMEESRKEDVFARSAPSAEAVDAMMEVLPDFTRSVVRGALIQNQGQLAGAINYLMDIGTDDDALAQLRAMSAQAKEEYADERLMEREKRLLECMAQLKREAAELAQQMKEAEQARVQAELRLRDAEKVAKKARGDLVDKTRERLLELEAPKDVASERLKAEKAQQEYAEYASEVELSIKAESDAGTLTPERMAAFEEEKARKFQLAQMLKQSLERLENKPTEADITLWIDVIRNEAARKTTERGRARLGLDRAETRLNALKGRDRELLGQQQELQREIDSLQVCAVRAEYSQREKRLIVSWHLQNYSPTSSDWIGVFSIDSTSPKEYHTYIPTESLRKSAHECALPSRPGLYVCCFFHGPLQQMIGTSEHIYLGPSLD